jgi:S-formylglutathione hydrolase
LRREANVLPGWSIEWIAGKPVQVFLPPGGAARFAALYLHPFGQEMPSEDSAYTTELSRQGLACCAPSGARSWWVDRICAEFDPEVTSEQFLVRHVVPWMRERWGLGARTLAALGISMGGQGALRLGFKYPETFPVVASVAGALDFHEIHGRGTPLDAMYEGREQCRQDTAILHLDPLRYPPHIWFACDPDDAAWHRGNDRLHEKLTAFGIPHVADLTTRDGGHSWQYFDRMAEPMLAFVAAGLVAESRRLA